METLNWEITTGCTNLGGGCESCPALLEYREKGWDYTIKMHPERLLEPINIVVFRNFAVSLGSDLFHDGVTSDFIKEVFDVMNQANQHTFEIVTKRPGRVAGMKSDLPWPPNIAMGVAVEEAEYKWRVDVLRTIPAKTRFVSFVPLLGPVGKINLKGIHRVGVRPETWGLKRNCKDEWIREIDEQCFNQGVVMTSEYYVYGNQEVV